MGVALPAAAQSNQSFWQNLWGTSYDGDDRLGGAARVSPRHTGWRLLASPAHPWTASPSPRMDYQEIGVRQSSISRSCRSPFPMTAKRQHPRYSTVHRSARTRPLGPRWRFAEPAPVCARRFGKHASAAKARKRALTPLRGKSYAHQTALDVKSQSWMVAKQTCRGKAKRGGLGAKVDRLNQQP